MANLLRDVQVIGEQLVDAGASAGSRRDMEALEFARRAGYEEGLRAGMEKGRLAVDERIKETLVTLEEATREVAASRTAAVGAAEADIVALALEVARKIVKDAAARQKGLAVATVREALKRIPDRSRLVVRIHPGCVAAVTEHRPEWLAAVGGPGVLEIQADRRVPPGGAEVHHPAGVVDARLETQLEEAFRLAVELQSAEDADATDYDGPLKGDVE